MIYHYLSPKLQENIIQPHIIVAGVGGTGSNFLVYLARINYALRKLGHIGLYVSAYDPDIVSEYNIGKQVYTENDIGQYKAPTIISKVNLHYGTQWDGFPIELSDKTSIQQSNAPKILITCVDSVFARKQVTIAKTDLLYWIDAGNSDSYGQIILSTWNYIKQPKSKFKTTTRLLNFFDLFPNSKDDPQEPSCSFAQSLERQDLLINSLMACNIANIIWQMFREIKVNYNGMFIHSKTLTTKQILINYEYDNRGK